MTVSASHCAVFFPDRMQDELYYTRTVGDGDDTSDEGSLHDSESEMDVDRSESEQEFTKVT